MDVYKENYYRWFLHSPFGIIICHQNGSIIATNRVADEILLQINRNKAYDNIIQCFDEENRVLIKHMLELCADGDAIHKTIFIQRDKEKLCLCVDAKGVWDDSILQNIVIFSFIDITAERNELNEVKLSEEKYRALVNLGGDAILVFNTNAVIVEVNIKAMALFGYSRKELVGKKLDELYEGSLLKQHITIFNEILTTGSAHVDLIQILTKDKKPVPVNISGTVVEYGRQNFVQMIFRDITEQLKAENEKNRLIAELNQIFNISAIGLCLIDENLIIVRANSAYKKFFTKGLPIVGKKCFEIFEGNGCGACRCEILNGKEMVEFELQIHQDGVEFNYYVVGIPFYNEKGERTGILQSVTDITQIRKLEKELICISNRERMHISQELHDGIGQILTGMSYLIEKLIRKMKDKESKEMKTLLDINDLAKDALEKTRNLVRSLVPIFTDENALITSINHLAEETKRLFGVNVQLEVDNVPKELASAEMTQLFYIIKEAVHNSVKHGKATIVLIKWVGKNNHYEIAISDNGKECTALLPSSTGMGLDIMKYRANLIGAQFFCGFEENGFTVRIKKIYKNS